VTEARVDGCGGISLMEKQGIPVFTVGSPLAENIFSSAKYRDIFY